MSGYLRGRAISVNGLVHIPGLGDFQMAQVRAVVTVWVLGPECDGGYISVCAP